MFQIRNPVRVRSVGAADRLEVRGDGIDYSFFADGRHIATVDGGLLSPQSSYAAGTPGFVGVWVGIFSESDEDVTAVAVTYAAQE